MKTCEITIKTEAVLYDVDAITYKRMDATMAAQSDREQNALSSDSAEDLDKYMLLRFIDARDARLRKRLSFALQSEEAETLSVSNEMPTGEAYSYKLNVPDNFTRDKSLSLVAQIHDYFVKGAAYDWYVNAGVQPLVTYEVLELLEQSIINMLRTSYVKRPIQPFGPR